MEKNRKVIWNVMRAGVIGLMLTLFGSVVPVPSMMAQSSNGAISGTVHDSSGAVVASATVTATNRETSLVRSTTTGADGHYKFPTLAVGTYDVKAEAEGFQAQQQQNLSLSVSQEAVINFSLTVGAVQETVSVTAAAPLVETTSGSVGGLVNEAAVKDLPLNGRNFNQLALLQTGITVHRPTSATSTTSIGLAFSSNGAPIRSNYITVDGASLTASSGITGSSVSGTMLGVDAVREFRVLTNFFQAEYGMTMGSQMIIVSKGGTNQYHGTEFEFLRNSALDAGSFFAGKSVFRRNNFGGAIGGPIRKDKSFFFANYEGVRESKGVPQQVNVPSDSARNGVIGGNPVTINPSVLPYLALYPRANGFLSSDPTGRNGVATYSYNFNQPTTENFGQIRYDHNFSENDQFFARYTVDDTKQDAPVAFPSFVNNRGSRGQFITASENHTISPTVLNSARLSFSRPFQNFDSPSPESLSFLPGTGITMGSLTVTGLTGNGPTATNPLIFHRNLFTLADDVAWVKEKHSFKFGFLGNRFRDYIATNNFRRGTMQFPSLQAFLAGTPSQLQVMFRGAVSDRTFAWNTMGFYAQDDWRITPRLTLNLGLRYEIATEVHEATGRGSAIRNFATDTQATLGPALYKQNTLKNFGPRVGFAWDIFGDGKMAVRGGAGIFYDITNITGAADIETTGTPPFSGTVILTPATGLRFPANSLPSASFDKISLRTVIYDQSQPHLLGYNFGIDRQLPSNMAISATFAGSRGISLPGTIEGNPTIPAFLADGTTKFWNPAIAIANFPRRNPAFASCECKTNGSDSWYDSLQLSLRRRMSKRLEFQASYTWGKLIDTAQGQHGGEAGGSNATGTDPERLRTDKGLSDFNVPQTFSFNSLFAVPTPDYKGVTGVLAKGWKLSSIFSAQNGLPFTAFLSGNRSNSGVLGGGTGNPDRPNVVPGCKVILGDPSAYFNPACFTVQAAGFLGNLGRNTFRGPNLVNLDLSFRKDTPMPFLGEAGSLEFRAEFFNILNHPSFAIPTDGRTVLTGTPTAASATPLTTAGKISRTVTDARQIQFALKVIF